MVLRGDPQLYFEALDILYKVKTVTLKMYNMLNIVSILPTSSDTLKLMKTLCVRHERRGIKSSAVGILQDVDLLAVLPCVQELENLHCDKKSTPLKSVKRMVQVFSLVKLTVETQINRFQRQTIVHIEESVNLPATKVASSSPDGLGYMWITASLETVLDWSEDGW